MSVQELHDLIAGMHQDFYDRNGPDAQIGMMLVIVVDGRATIVDFDGDSRSDWYAKAAAIVHVTEASAYCIVSEAWMANITRADDPVAKLAPSQREDKSEVVTTVCVDCEGGRAASVQVIDRDAHSGRVANLSKLGGLDLADGDMFRLFGWLN